MKQITIEGREFDYTVVTQYISPSYWETKRVTTIFYFHKKTRDVVHYKFLIWGKYIIKEPVEAFRLNVDIESKEYTKEEIKKEIMHHYLRLIRQEEIDNGTII